MAIPAVVAALGIGVRTWKAYSAAKKAKILKVATKQAKRKPGGGTLTSPRASDVDKGVKSISRGMKRQKVLAATTTAALSIEEKNTKKRKVKKKKK